MARPLLWDKGVSGVPNFGLLAARPPAGAQVYGMTFWATDQPVGSQISECVETAADVFAWETLQVGSATPAAVLALNTARTFSYTNAAPSFTNVVQVSQASALGHQYITATFLGDLGGAIGASVEFQIIDMVSITVVLAVGPYALPAGVGESSITLPTAANLPAGNHTWTLQAMPSAGATLSGIYATITVQDLSAAA